MKHQIINVHYRYINIYIRYKLFIFSLTFSIEFNIMRIVMSLEKLLNNMKLYYLVRFL